MWSANWQLGLNRKNKQWVEKGIFLEQVLWENFLDAVSQTRLQDEYNKAIREADIFVMLFFTKVGKYTEEEFGTAFTQFKNTNKPFVFTYFKDAEVNISTANKNDLQSFWAFQEKLDQSGHFYTVYKNIEGLREHFNNQLDKLAENGFIELNHQREDRPTDAGTTVTNSKNVNTGTMQAGGKIVIGDNNT